MFAHQYDEAHYERVASLRAGDRLSQFLPYQEYLSHISTVFYTPTLAIEVGKDDPRLQAYMRAEGIRSLVGLTPQFPIQNPAATTQQNDQYIREFTQLLKSHNISHLSCQGRARDFRQGGAGCFILIDVRTALVKRVLLKEGRPTQLSFTCLYQHGKAQLISCIEEYVPEKATVTL